MNIYDVIVESLLEGQVKAANKAKKNARDDIDGKDHKQYVQSLKGHKRLKQELGTSTDRTAGRRINRIRQSYNSPFFWGNAAAEDRKAGKKDSARAQIKKSRDSNKPKLPESLAYEIYDIICEGLVKAANKAKKNAKIKKLGGREQNRVNQSYNGPLAGVRLAGDYRRDAVKAGKPENVIGTGEKDFHNRLLKNKIGSGRVNRKLP